MPETTGRQRIERIISVEGESWLLVVHSVVAEGKRLPVGVEMWSVPPHSHYGFCDEGEDGVSWPGRPVPITSPVLRNAKLMTRITGALATAQRLAADRAEPEPWDGFNESVSAPLAHPAPGRPEKYGDAHYRQVAKVYEEAASAGKAPTPPVTRNWQCSTSTAERWIREARTRGFLAETDRTKRSRPAHYTREHWQAVADAYADAPNPTRPTQYVRRVMGEALGVPVSESEASNWVRRARKDGLIPEAGAGSLGVIRSAQVTSR